MSWNSGPGLDTAIGASIGGALVRPVVAARLRRFARESSGYLDEGEKLAAPLPVCTCGARVLLRAGLAIFAAALVAGFVVGSVNESLFGVVFFGGTGAGLVLGWLWAFMAHRYAVALTDRRLIVFRVSSASGRRIPARHIQDIFIAVPRSDVSTDFTTWFGLGTLSLEFAPATGQAPIQLDSTNPVDKQIAMAIHQALATTAAKGPGPTRLPAGQ